MISDENKSDSIVNNSTNEKDQDQVKSNQHINVSQKLSHGTTSGSSPIKEPHPPTNSYLHSISPSTIPGMLHMGNYGAIDWSLNGLVAYGCQNRIIVVDANNSSLNYCQSLHRHKHVVCFVKWASIVDNLSLASADTSGVIIIWNVIDSTPLTVILSTNETKTMSFLHWICLDIKQTDNNTINSWNLSSQNDLNKKPEDVAYKSNLQKTSSFLLVFYQQINSFILYDTEHGEAIVRWQMDFKITHINFNPFFTFNRSCDSSVYNLLVGFKPSQNNDDKIYLGLARLNESDFKRDDSSKEPKKLSLSFVTYVLQNSFHDASNKANRPSRYDLIEQLDHNKQADYLSSINEIVQNHSSNVAQQSGSYENYIQLEYHKAVRNQIFIVFVRDIYLVDLSIETIINVIPIERNCSKIVKIFSCSHRNAFYAFHETGNISFRLYQKKVIHDRSNMNQNNAIDNCQNDDGSLDLSANDFSIGMSSFLNVGYINLCQSEAIRLTKQNKVFGYSVSPFNETQVAFLLSSGRIVVKSVVCQKAQIDSKTNTSFSYIVNNLDPISSLSDLIKPQEYKLGAFLVSDSFDQQKSFDSILYKVIVTHFISGLNSLPVVIRMCPPLTLQNIRKHRPLLAVGDSLGLIQIWFLVNNTSRLHREFSVHSYPIAGIEWTGLTSLISFAYPTITSPSHHSSVSNTALNAFNMVTGSGSSSGRVTNELIHIDIETGKTTGFRTNRIHDSSPIETIRVSHLKQYLIILFKRDDPFEIWDVKTLLLLRVMPKNMANITAIEWSPLYNKKHVARNSEVSDSDTSQTVAAYIPSKENFIVTNRNLFHFSIEGNVVRELACIPPDSESGHVSVTCIAWKSDQVLLGDASGTINVWDLKRKNSVTESTFRGYIRKIRFGPGRGNMKCLILYADYGVDICEINDFRACAQLKYPRDINFKIIDIDWASCDLPILCTTEGFIFVTDIKLKTYSSPITFKEFSKSEINEIIDADYFENDNYKLPTPMFGVNDLDFNIKFKSSDSKKQLLRQSLFKFPFKVTASDEQLDGLNTFPSIDLKKYIYSQITVAKIFTNSDDYDFWVILASILYGEELDSRLDLFLDATQFRNLQQEKLLLLEANRKTYSHACHAYQLNLRLKNFQRAVQILLETEAFLQPNGNNALYGDNAFYVDALKACLIASLQSDLTAKSKSHKDKNTVDNAIDNASCDNFDMSDNCEDSSLVNSATNVQINLGAKDVVAPVVKLVATNLIANGHILEGVELLNLISKTSDSCRYLQSAEKWLDSIWLAKTNLDVNECTEVMRRWCDYLISSKNYSDQQTAAKMYLSRRQFSRVLRSLNHQSELKSFSFAVVCIAAQLIDIPTNRDILEEIFDKFVAFFYTNNAELLLQIKSSRKQMSDGGDSTAPDSKKPDQLADVDTEEFDNLCKCWLMFAGELTSN